RRRPQQAVTGPASVRVLLADAEPLQRSGWRLAIDSQDDLEVVAEAGDGVQALTLLRRVPVDVAVLDVRLPRMSGVQVAERVPEGGWGRGPVGRGRRRGGRPAPGAPRTSRRRTSTSAGPACPPARPRRRRARRSRRRGRARGTAGW